MTMLVRPRSSRLSTRQLVEGRWPSNVVYDHRQDREAAQEVEPEVPPLRTGKCHRVQPAGRCRVDRACSHQLGTEVREGVSTCSPRAFDSDATTRGGSTPGSITRTPAPVAGPAGGQTERCLDTAPALPRAYSTDDPHPNVTQSPGHRYSAITIWGVPRDLPQVAISVLEIRSVATPERN